MVLGLAHQLELLIGFIDTLVPNRPSKQGKQQENKGDQSDEHDHILTTSSKMTITLPSSRANKTVIDEKLSFC